MTANVKAKPPESFEALCHELAPGMGADRLAKRCGTAPNTIRNLMRGKCDRVHRGTVTMLSLGLGCDIERLFAAIEQSRHLAEKRALRQARKGKP
jgi:transcriptional regulator with XRE-family HTH domain